MTADAPRTPVNELADRFWEAVLEQSPIVATIYGDERYDDRLPDPGPAGRDARRRLAEETRAAALAIPEDGLSTEDRITRDMLLSSARNLLEELDDRFDIYAAVDQMDGMQQVLPTLVSMQRADTPERLEKFLARLRAYPAFAAATTELAREGIPAGIVQPRIIVERTIAQMERLEAIPLEEHPVVTAVQVASAADRDKVAALVRDAVRPAEAAYLEMLRKEYLPASRVNPGLCWAPNGESVYRTRIRTWTTLEMDPREIHRIGLEELELIEAERREISRAAGFKDDTAAYRRALWAEESNIPRTREEVVARANEDIERALAVAPRFFGRLPRTSCEVKPVEPYKEADAPFAYYYPPSTDGARPGSYYVNTYDLPSRTYSQLASTTYHEAIPGHHFQIAIEMELEGLPAFRRLGSGMDGAAYAEGWGLYAERLADEAGLYRNEGERFGMLDAQAWRAARLVVDTGIHGLRWTRQQGIDQLLAAGLTETNAVIETDRFTMWPGQALTYKLGQREISRLRNEIAARDGAAFDLRAFHDALIGHGSVPLATLARELPRWVTPAR